MDRADACFACSVIVLGSVLAAECCILCVSSCNAVFVVCRFDTRRSAGAVRFFVLVWPDRASVTGARMRSSRPIAALRGPITIPGPLLYVSDFFYFWVHSDLVRKKTFTTIPDNPMYRYHSYE